MVLWFGRSASDLLVSSTVLNCYDHVCCAIMGTVVSVQAGVVGDSFLIFPFVLIFLRSGRPVPGCSVVAHFASCQNSRSFMVYLVVSGMMMDDGRWADVVCRLHCQADVDHLRKCSTPHNIIDHSCRLPKCWVPLGPP